jgi:hypothetical protein
MDVRLFGQTYVILWPGGFFAADTFLQSFGDRPSIFRQK